MYDMPFSSIPRKHDEFVESFNKKQIMCYSTDWLEGYVKDNFKPNMGPLMFITTSGPTTSPHIDGKVS